MSTKPLVGIGVLIFNNEGHLLLGKRLGAHGDASWGPPGGHLEFGESFESCAKREALEESGLEIESVEFHAVTNDIFQEEGKHYVSIFMRAFIDSDQDPQNLEPHKTEVWQWFDPTTLPDNLFLPLKNLVERGSLKLPIS